MTQAEADRNLDKVAFRGEQWWYDKENSLNKAVQQLNLPASVKDWIGQVAIQAWAEGAVTAVQEYGDELRARGDLPPMQRKGRRA